MANNFWSDFDDSLGKQSNGDIQKDSDVDAIFNSIRNIMLTIQGERRMLPTFASNVSRLLFEPIDEITAKLIAEGLIESIRIWDDRIEITGFDIEPREDENTYRCRLKFIVLGSDDVETIDFILTR
jgi:phage baseplate assembly protein W